MDNVELKDLIISWFALSLAFMIAVRLVSLEYFLMFLFIIGASFISHEIAHRQV
ncbi:MAG: site-2 protease family protein, partial [Candidatus Aenigmatarchaeota archaeon]